MSDEQHVHDLMRRYARNHVALDARILALEFDPDNLIWVATVTSSTAKACRLLARREDDQWRVWRYLGSLPKPKDRD